MMQIRSHFNIGQKVFRVEGQSVHIFEKCPCCVHGQLCALDGEEFKCPRCNGKGVISEHCRLRYHVVNPMTVGQIRFEISLDKSEEAYMCYETGVGSGSIYKCADLFETAELAQEEADKRNNMAAQEWVCVRCIPKYSPVEYLVPSSGRGWRYCPVHGGSTNHLEVDNANSTLEAYLKREAERKKKDE